MDKYVTFRKSVHSFTSLSSTTGNQSTPKEKQFSAATVTSSARSSRTQNLNLNEALLRVFSSQPDEPLDGSAYFEEAYGDENIPPQPEAAAKNHRKLYNDDHPTNANNSGKKLYQAEKIVTKTASPRQAATKEVIGASKIMLSPDLPTNSTGLTPDIDKNSQKYNPVLARLRRDFYSPSANARVRALRALKSPTMSIYNKFDVPYEEQDIITDEERKGTVCPNSIQEVMRDIVVYVEVRTAEDNRTAGVKKTISSYGAKVNERLLRNTTHVIFKDGLQSTYNKAKKWNIPIVSVLWIEECKKQMRIISPSRFPILNLERYENPELFAKIRRQKSMQPNAEMLSRHNRYKQLKKKKTEAERAIKIKSSIRIPRKPKNNVNEILSDFKDRLLDTSGGTDCDDIFPIESKFLQIIRDSPFTPKASEEKPGSSIDETNSDINSDEDFESNLQNKTKTPLPKARKSLFSRTLYNDTRKKSPTISATPKAIQSGTKIVKKTPEKLPDRRESDDTSTSSLDVQPPGSSSQSEFSEISAANSTISENPRRSRRSSSSVFATANRKPILSEAATLKTNRRRTTIFAPNSIDNIMEESVQITSEDKISYANVGKNRRTTLTSKAMELSALDDNQNVTTIETDTTFTPIVKTNKRRTLYTPALMDETTICLTNTLTKNSSNRRRTVFNPSNASDEIAADNATKDQHFIGLNCVYNVGTPKNKAKTLLDDLNSTTLAFSSTRLPNSSTRRRTLYDISMDIIDQRVHNINESVREETLKKNFRTPISSVKKSSTVIERQRNDTVQRATSQIRQPQSAVKSAKSVKKIPTDYVALKNVAKPQINGTTKRKLFAPTEMFSTPEPVPVESKSTSAGPKPDRLSLLKTYTSIKRPRDLCFNRQYSQLEKKLKAYPGKKFDIAQRSTVAGTEISAKKLIRRSSQEFQTISKFKANATETATTIEKPSNNITNAKSIENTSAIDKPQLPFLVYTNMHKEQIEFLQEALKKLGGFELEPSVSDRTTHVITLEARRTLNILRGIIRGLWILNYDWILDSMSEGKWINEERYEICNFSKAVEACRAERQAFGSGYKIELFADLGPIYVSSKSSIPHENLKELIRLCSGKLVENHNKAKYIIGENKKLTKDDDSQTLCLEPIWILDSISVNKIMKVKKYLLKNDNMKKCD